MTRVRSFILVALMLAGPLLAPWAQPAAAAGPAVTLPASGTPGSKVNYSVSGFPASATVTIKWDGEKIGSVAVDHAGRKSGSFTIPRAPKGTHRVRFVSGSAGITKLFAVVPGFTLSVKSAKPGDRFKMYARGLVPNTAVRAGYLSCCGIMESQDTGKASDTGSIDLDLTVPSSWNPNDRPTFIATLEYVNPFGRIHVELPVVAESGQSLRLTLASTNIKVGRPLGYTITSSFKNTSVQLLFDATKIGTVKTNGSGGVSGEFTVPQATSSKLHAVSIEVGASRSSVTVYIQPSMLVAPDPVARGSTVTIKAVGFAIGEPVRACFWLGGGCTTIGTKSTSSKGSATFTWRIPADWGTHPSVYLYIYYGNGLYRYWILGILPKTTAADIVEPTPTSAPVVTPTAEAQPTETPVVQDTPEPTAPPDEPSTPEPTPEPTVAPTEVFSPEPTPAADVEAPGIPPAASPETTPPM